MKLGLSTWSLLHQDVYSAVRMIGDAGFEYIELWGEVPHAFLGWVDRRRLQDSLSSYSMLLTTHAPFTELNPSSPFQPVRAAVERTLDDFISFSADLGAKMVTVHPGSVHSEELVPQAVHSSIATLRRMIRTAGGRLSVNVENMTGSHGAYHFPLASTTESLELILAEVEGLRLTLDTGHAHVNGQSPLDLAVRFQSKLSEVHLSDNSGGVDRHLFPGEGDAQLDELLWRLNPGNTPVCLEVDPYHYTAEEVLARSIRWKDVRGELSPRGQG
jgi:sugar phosphate isomerase/epimerase